MPPEGKGHLWLYSELSIGWNAVWVLMRQFESAMFLSCPTPHFSQGQHRLPSYLRSKFGSHLSFSLLQTLLGKGLDLGQKT